MKTILRVSTKDLPTVGVYTAQPVEVAQDSNSTVIPEFIRLPKPGTREPFTGLSRSKLNELVLPSKSNAFKPPVRSVVLRKRGAIRGVRLIVLDSLIRYLYGQIEQGDAWDFRGTGS